MRVESRGWLRVSLEKGMGEGRLNDDTYFLSPANVSIGGMFRATCSTVFVVQRNAHACELVAESAQSPSFLNPQPVRALSSTVATLLWPQLYPPTYLCWLIIALGRGGLHSCLRTVHPPPTPNRVTLRKTFSSLSLCLLIPKSEACKCRASPFFFLLLSGFDFLFCYSPLPLPLALH